MRLRYLLEKEFLQIFRNKAMLPIIFIMPAIQLVVLSFAATYELQNVNFYVVAPEHTTMPEQLVQRFRANQYFTLTGMGGDREEAKQKIAAGSVDMALMLTTDMDKKMERDRRVRVLFMIDAVSSNKASLIQSYSQAIVQDYNGEILPEYSWLQSSPRQAGFITRTRIWFNPTLDYIHYMVPGILVVLISMIALFLSAMNIVREKEIGTMEQLNVTPIRKSEFIVSKLLPMWILALLELTVGLGIAVWGFGVPIEGSLATIYSTSAIYLIAVQGIGLYISTITFTQQQAMFISWFVMVIFILMGGLFTPIESMPGWAQQLAYLNPVAYYIEIMRMIMLKGSGYFDFWPQMLVLTLFAVGSVGFSISRYRKSQQD